MNSKIMPYYNCETCANKGKGCWMCCVVTPKSPYICYMEKVKVNEPDCTSIKLEVEKGRQIMLKRILVIVFILLGLVTRVYAHKDIEADYFIHKLVAEYRDMYPDQQIRAIHDYLVRNVEYDYNYAEDSYTTYGALINGKAVCQGYSFAFHDIATELGINSNICIGTVDEVVHSWNFVILRGRGYFIDVTFADTMNTEEYYMVSAIRNHYLMFMLY